MQNTKLIDVMYVQIIMAVFVMTLFASSFTDP